MHIRMQYLHLKIVKNMQIYRKCTEAPPFRAIFAAASAAKRDTGGQYSRNKGSKKQPVIVRSPAALRTSEAACQIQSTFSKKRRSKVNLTPTSWQGHKDLNPEPTVLETAALPIELYPYMVGLRGLEPGTGRL